MNTIDINFSEISDQQYADLIAYFVRKKSADEIVIHDGDFDITITRQVVRRNDKDIIDTSVAAYIAVAATTLL